MATPTLVDLCAAALAALDVCEVAPLAPSDRIDREWAAVPDDALKAKEALHDLGVALSAGLQAVQLAVTSDTTDARASAHLFGQVSSSWQRHHEVLERRTRALSKSGEECAASPPVSRG
jgi:hypothetical protein